MLPCILESRKSKVYGKRDALFAYQTFVIVGERGIRRSPPLQQSQPSGSLSTWTPEWDESKGEANTRFDYKTEAAHLTREESKLKNLQGAFIAALHITWTS